MENNLISTIRLSADESIDFVNALFRPSRDMIEQHNRILDEINSEITIRRTDDGFEADIADLDLSILSDKDKNTISMVTTVKLNAQDDFFSNNDRVTTTTVLLKTMEVYGVILNSSCFNAAA